MTVPATTEVPADDQALLALVADGDCKRLSDDQKRRYYVMRCEAAGLDPRAQPFEFTNLNGKLVLYAKKAATDQLSHKYGLSQELRSLTTTDGICRAHVRITDPSGRFVDDLGAVSVGSLKGDALCNAEMKAVTKGGRRATLRYAGLGLLDESELETIPARALAEGPRFRHAEAKQQDPQDGAGWGEGPPVPVAREEAPIVEAMMEDALQGDLADASIGFFPDTQQPPPTITEKERRFLFAELKLNGRTPDQLKAWFKPKGITSTKAIPVTMFAEMLSWIRHGEA